MRLRLVRHGESEGNVMATLQGCRVDTPLSARGRRQAESLAIRLAGEDVDAVVASPMRRALETAQVIAAPHGLGVRVDSDFVEFDWGKWTGRPFDDALEREVADLRARWRAGDVDVPAPGGESPLRALSRVTRGVERLRAAGVAAPVVVAHGRINRVLVTHVLGRHLSRMDEVRQRNGTLSVFDWNDGAPASALLLDDVAHMASELVVDTGGSDSIR
jgi:probable phosphoglycerate mutase